MKMNTLLLASLILVSGNAAWAGCGPPQCPWPWDPNIGDGPYNPPPTPVGPKGLVQDFAIVVDCQKACATCGAGQACYCDPESGFSCENRPQNFSLFVNDENGLPVLQQD